MRNPFLLKGYISEGYFCDRNKETADLIRYITNENNVVLISPRRMGKTGLIEHCFRRKEISNQYSELLIQYLIIN